MKVKITVSLILLILLCGIDAFPQKDKCVELQKLIDKTYNFKPSKLNEQEQTAKSAEMDIVWNKVKSDKENFVPCLKKAMQKTDANNFFVFDASNLIFSFDKSDESKKFLVKSYSKVDLSDVNLAYWLPYVAALGYEGFDTTAAGDNWLRSSVEGFYLPQHGTRKVTKNIGSIVIFGSMDEKFATPALAKIASDEKHPAREIAVYLLAQQTTPEAFRELKSLDKKGFSESVKTAINNFVNNPKILKPREGEPKTTREQYLEAFQELANGKSKKFIELTIEVPDGEKDAVAVLKKEDIPLIRKARRYFAATANPHSPEWYKSFTNILMTMLYKDFKEN